MVKLRKDERICLKCGKKFRVKGNPRNIQTCPGGCLKVCPVCGKQFKTNKSNEVCCSDKCKRERNKRRAEHRASLGTPNTLNLSPKAVRREVMRIRKNIDKQYSFSNGKSVREIMVSNYCYNEDMEELYQVRG